MRRLLVLLLLSVSGAAFSEPPAGTADPRQPIHLAPARRDNWRCLMRGHLSSLIDSMRLLSAGSYEAAAATTEDHYGLRPGTAEFCHESMFTPEASIAAAKLLPNAPDPIPAMFVSMHEAARAFALEARKAKTTGDAALAWKALATMAEYCNACHAGYRLD